MTRTLAALCLTLAGCSQPGTASQPDAAPTTVGPATASRATTGAPPVAPAPAPVAAKPAADAGSRVLGKKDMALRGKPACEIAYVYAGHEPETLFWEEPCKAVTAKMMMRPELESLGKWTWLDEFAQKFVAALPGGKVLYVEGGFSASVYPIGTTGSPYEVPVAD